MSEKVTIFHNPKFSKSRATLQLLVEKGIKPIIIEYLKIPLNPKILKSILEKLGKEPRDIMRKKEQCYISNNLDNETLNYSELISAMIKNPILIERPIVIIGDKAAIGRPPEAILKII